MRRLTVGGSQSPQVTQWIISNFDMMNPVFLTGLTGFTGFKKIYCFYPVHPVNPV
jgi:hypothetical protein